MKTITKRPACASLAQEEPGLPKRRSKWAAIKKHWPLYLILLPGLCHYIIFRYVPLFGITIAFKDLDLYKGIWDSPWVGLKHFIDIFNSNDIWLLIRNTVLLGLYTLIWGMTIPVFFAIMLNEIRARPVKKLVQSVSYFPSLLSTVVICSMITDFLSPNTGIINTLMASLGFPKHYFMIDPDWYRTVYVASEVWQKFGYNAIIYFAAISSIDTQLYEAAQIDGCGRLKRIWHITLPGLLPTICVMLIMNAGSIFRIGADKGLLLYNPMTYEVADIFGTFVYRKGIIESDYSYAAAAGLFESVVSFALVYTTNWLSKRYTENSLW